MCLMVASLRVRGRFGRGTRRRETSCHHPVEAVLDGPVAATIGPSRAATMTREAR